MLLQEGALKKEDESGDESANKTLLESEPKISKKESTTNKRSKASGLNKLQGVALEEFNQSVKILKVTEERGPQWHTIALNHQKERLTMEKNGTNLRVLGEMKRNEENPNGNGFEDRGDETCSRFQRVPANIPLPMELLAPPPNSPEPSDPCTHTECEVAMEFGIFWNSGQVSTAQASETTEAAGTASRYVCVARFD